MFRKLSLAAVCAATMFSAQPSQAMNIYQCIMQFRDIVQANPEGSLIMAEQHYGGRRISDNEYVRYWIGQAYNTCAPW